jgi:HEAT repeat protein
MKSANICAAVLLLGTWASAHAVRAQDAPVEAIAEDEKVLKSAKVPVDGKGLLAYLHAQVPKAEDEKQVADLFKRLDSDAFKDRQEASAALIAMGSRIVPLLRRHLQAPSSLEVRRRAETCLVALEKESTAGVAAAVIRLLKTRNPAGACAALLEYAPFAADEACAEEVLDTLYALGVVKGKVDPTLEAALRDPDATRRALSAVLVGRFGTPEQRKAVGALLDDKVAAVRFRAAQGLLGAGVRDALPVLVDSLRQAPLNLAERAEEILLQAAAATAPKVALTSDAAARAKCHQAWTAWLKEHQAKVDLSKADVGLPLGNPNFRAREVARQFLDTAFKPNADKVHRLTELPFNLAGQKVINTRAEWDAHLKQGQQDQPANMKFKLDLGKVMTLTEYLPKAPAQEKAFLQKCAPSEVRVVLVNVGIEEAAANVQTKITFTMAFFIRINGARARIFGIGTPAISPKE